MHRFGIAAAAVLFAAVSGTAYSQTARSPAGDWMGDLVIPAGTYEIGLRIEEASPGVFKGSIGSHDTGRWGTPLEAITFDAGALTFTAPAANASFKGAWDPQAPGFTGTYTSAGGPAPMTFKAGVVPPLPTVPGLDGRWEGDLQGIGVVLRISSGPRGTATLADYPSINRNNVVIRTLTRDGQKVALASANGQVAFTGTLSADGTTLAGTWTQQTFEIPVTLTKK